MHKKIGTKPAVSTKATGQKTTTRDTTSRAAGIAPEGAHMSKARKAPKLR